MLFCLPGGSLLHELNRHSSRVHPVFLRVMPNFKNNVYFDTWMERTTLIEFIINVVSYFLQE